jgi:hypothetical protein
MGPRSFSHWAGPPHFTWPQFPEQVSKALYTTAVDLAKAGSSFDSDLDEDFAFDGAYPISFEPDSSVVCPYWDLLKSQLQAKPIAIAADPAQTLAINGQPLELVQALNLDADSKEEYAGILQTERPLIVILDAASDSWRIYPVEFVDRAVIGLSATAAPTDSVADAQVLLLIQFDSSTRGETTGCAPESKDFRLILAAPGKDDYRLMGWRGFSCQAQPPVELQTEQGRKTFIALINECNRCDLINDFHREQPSWVEIRGLSDELPTNVNVFRYIDAIDSEVLQGENLSQNQAKIAQLLGYLPSDIPAAIILHRHLRYLSALSYELEGKVDLAIAGYLKLMQEDPDTLWAKLAQTRLTTTTSTGTP